MRIPFMNQVAWYLVAVMFVIGICPRLDAGVVPSEVIASSVYERSADIEKIRQVLEMKAVKERLGQLGFTGDEINARFSQLDDQQVHQLAQQIDDLRVGGDGALGVIIAILVIVLLVILILHLTGHKVIVTK